MDGKRRIWKWGLIGFAFISALGAVMHFVFEWTGEMPWVGVFAPVNESVFEHLKLPFWPVLLWAALEYRKVKEYTENFTVAKAVSLLVIPGAILAIFYGYTTATGTESLIADILLFIGSVALGQYVGYRIMIREPLPSGLFKAAVAGLIAMGVVYAVLTFYPPEVPLFLDSGSGTYGIP